MDLPAPDEVAWIARTLEEAGHSAWAVGGAVRDALRGAQPEDWDLTTSARPDQVRRLFRRTAPIGVQYGTVGVIARDGRMYEVTTFRQDVETFGRKARVAFSDSLEEDLARRDFTINAVAWQPRTKEVRDPHQGMRDLADGVLRTVGDAERRFEEDRLRVLRALRFAGQFELAIEPATWNAIVASADRLGGLSAERIRDELWKILGGRGTPSRSLALYAEAGVLAALYPELEACRGLGGPDLPADVWTTQLRAVDALSRRRPLLRVAALLCFSGAGAAPAMGDTRSALAAGRSAAIARRVLRRLRVSNADTDTVTHLVAQRVPLPDVGGADADLRRWVRKVGRDHVDDIVRLNAAVARATGWDHRQRRGLRRLRERATALARSSIPLAVAELPITGDDLRALGIPPGPLYGEILRELLDLVTDDPDLNERATLMRIVADRMS